LLGHALKLDDQVLFGCDLSTFNIQLASKSPDF